MRIWTGLLLAAVTLGNAALPQTGSNLMTSNRLEYRRSDDTHADNLDNWLDADAWFGSTRVGFRLEVHQKDPRSSREELTQRYLEYRGQNLRLRVGNFYEKIGQGLLFQSFELQTFVLDRIERSLVLDRNADGVWLEYNSGVLEAHLFSGRSLDPFANRRGDLIRGADVNVWLMGRVKLGASSARWLPVNQQVTPASTLNASRVEWFYGPLNGGVEHAWQQSAASDRNDRRATYSYVNFSLARASFSLEWKDYRNFHLPFNNPPSLVPTHPVALLNRHTHVLNANDERGYQLQITWNPVDPLSLVLNANGGGDHGNSERSKYGEVFLDARYEVLGSWASRLVMDRAYDHGFDQTDRRTLALELERYLPNGWSVFLDFQAQKIRLQSAGSYSNLLTVFSFSRSPTLSVSFQLDRSTNRFETHRWLPALVATYVLKEKHQITVTVGGRRAGLLCSGGVCVLVPEFRGVELRLTSRM